MTRFVLITLSLVTGCSHFHPACPGNPYQEQPYIRGVYTCSDISADYSRHLNTCGYDTRVIAGDVRGYSMPHAWIEIIYEEEVYWIDPTWEWSCFPASQWTDRVAKWKYERNVSGNEVKAYRKKKRHFIRLK